MEGGQLLKQLLNGDPKSYFELRRLVLFVSSLQSTYTVVGATVTALPVGRDPLQSQAGRTLERSPTPNCALTWVGSHVYGSTWTELRMDTFRVGPTSSCHSLAWHLHLPMLAPLVANDSQFPALQPKRAGPSFSPTPTPQIAVSPSSVLPNFRCEPCLPGLRCDADSAESNRRPCRCTFHSWLWQPSGLLLRPSSGDSCTPRHRPRPRPRPRPQLRHGLPEHVLLRCTPVDRTSSRPNSAHPVPVSCIWLPKCPLSSTARTRLSILSRQPSSTSIRLSSTVSRTRRPMGTSFSHHNRNPPQMTAFTRARHTQHRHQTSPNPSPSPSPS